MTTIYATTRIVNELTFHSGKDYDNPFWDVTVQVKFVSPTGQVRRRDAFWDGGRIWKVRFSADEEGGWTYRVLCSDSADRGLNGLAGVIELGPYTGTNPVYAKGTVRISDDGTRFEYGDGTPFLWMGDTAWNGVLLAELDDWNRYLSIRRHQGFNVILFNLTQWRGLEHDKAGETAFSGTARIRIHPSFYQRLDAKVEAINENGLIAAPILLWSCTPNDPGNCLPVEDAIKLARYHAARFGAYQVVYILGGDGNFTGAREERWKRIGREVLDVHNRDRLATLHPGDQMWVADEYRDEPWFDFVGYQSGHGNGHKRLDWLVNGFASKEWKKHPKRPVIELEPCYEDHPVYEQNGIPFTKRETRRALYWNLLITPTVGVTYGSLHIWPWLEEAGEPVGHTGHRSLAWHQGIYSDGATAMGHIRTLLESLPWTTLRPSPELLSEQPGIKDATRYVGVAISEDARCLLAYFPEGGTHTLNLRSMPKPIRAQWFNPRTGEWTPAAGKGNQEQTFEAMDREDWVLCLRSET